MIKKFLAILLVLVMCALSACSLIDKSGETDNDNLPELKITADFMVGMSLHVEKYDSVAGTHVTYPTDKFDDENAISLYEAARNEDGLAYVELISSEYLSDIFHGISNFGTTISEDRPSGGLELRATFMYTYEMLGGVLYIDSVFKKNGKDEYYVPDGPKTGEYLNNIGYVSHSSHQTLQVSQTDISGNVKKLQYDGKWAVNIKFTDYLISAKTVEFDKNHNVINTQNINIGSDGFTEYKTKPDCEYIFVEEEYEVKHSDENYKYPIGTKYTERHFFNKSTENKKHTLPIPVGNGFVKNLGLYIKF